ncbi:MAG TPA: hypothetical protein VGE79_05475, partial [Niastella sp.]
MKHYNYLSCFIIAVIACNPVQRITGNKPNGSNYVLTIEPGSNAGDSVLITGHVGVVDSNMAVRFLQIVKLDTSGYSKTVGPDMQGNFRYLVSPGRYYLAFGGIGYGKMKTNEFVIKPEQSATLKTLLHHEE